MIIPVRCMTCGKVLADKWNAYSKQVEKLTKQKENQDDEPTLKNFEQNHKGGILKDLGITKMCCKRHMLTHIDIIDSL